MQDNSVSMCIDYSTDPYCALCYRSWVARVNQITIVRTTPTHDGGEAAVTHGGGAVKLAN